MDSPKVTYSKGSGEEDETPAQHVDTSPFAASDGLSDLTLVVEGKNLYVHKMVLAKTSPVFRAMFYPQSGTGFKEKDAVELELKDKKYDDIVNFLTQMYPDYNHAPITDDLLVGVVGLADEYQVEHVMTKCRKYVKEQLKDVSRLSTEQLVMYLWLCKRYRNGLCTHDSAGGTSNRTLEQTPLKAQLAGSASSIFGSTALLKRQKSDSGSYDLAMEGVIRRPLQEVQQCHYYSQFTENEQHHIVLRRCQRLETSVVLFVKKIATSSSYFSNPSNSCSCNMYQVRRFGPENPRGVFCSSCISEVAKSIMQMKS